MTDDAKAVDKAIFGTDDPETIRLMFQRACQQQKEREGTFGGYLRALRRRRGLTETEISRKAGLPRATWLNWEANSQIPSLEEFSLVMNRLELSPTKQDRLRELLADAPKHALRDLSQFRFENLAARGVATVDVELEWEALGPAVQEKLMVWAETKGLDFPRELLTFVRGLDSQEQRESWLDEVMRDNHAQ